MSALSAPAIGDPNSLQIQLLSPSEVEAEPRQMLTTSILLSNSSGEHQTCEIAAETPSGWQYVALPESLELGPGDSEVAFVSVAVPPSALAGDYGLVLMAFPEGMPSDIVSEKVTVRVARVAQLEVRPSRPHQPDALSGDEFAQSFVATNLGNAPTRVGIEVESYPDWPVAVDPPDMVLRLELCQSETIGVTVSVPEELSRSITHRLTLIARSLEPGAEDITARARTSTYVIPAQLPEESIYPVLDGVTRTALAVQDDGEPAFTVSLDNLQGDLGNGRRGKAELRDIPLYGDSSGSFTRRQRLTSEYRDERGVEVRAGDFRSDLFSPLVGRRVSGRGAEVVFGGSGTESRVFYTRTRGSTASEIAGLQLVQRLRGGTTVGVTALRNSDVVAPGGAPGQGIAGTSFSVAASYSPFRGAELTGEAARSASEHPGWDGAWRFQGRYRADRFAATCEWVRAGAGFHGGWQDMEVGRTYLSWSPADDLRLWTDYNRTRTNLTDDPDVEGRCYRNEGFGAVWNIEELGRVRISRRTMRIYDVLLDRCDSTTSINVYSFSRSWGDVTTTATWQCQSDEAVPVGELAVDRSLGLELAARLDRASSLRLGYSFGRSAEHNGQDSFRTTGFSLGGRVSLDSELVLSWDYQRNTGGLRGRRARFGGMLTWDLPQDRELGLRIRSYSGTYGSDTEMVLEFVQPTSIPIRVLPLRGSAEGRVFLAANPDEGVRGITVAVGDLEVITDDRGYFRFPSLDPGEHQLTLDMAGLGVGMAPALDLPLVFAVEAGSATKLEIPVTETVAIGGRVFLERPGSPGEEALLVPWGGLLIQLQRESWSDYRRADSFGRFLFADLVPGSYAVVLRAEFLPEYHEVLGPDNYALELAPGESRTDLEFRIGLVERAIEITFEADETQRE